MGHGIGQDVLLETEIAADMVAMAADAVARAADAVAVADGVHDPIPSPEMFSKKSGGQKSNAFYPQNTFQYTVGMLGAAFQAYMHMNIETRTFAVITSAMRKTKHKETFVII